ncbi:MAG: hypothetical protein ACO3ZY_02725 [Phycisphaerales bacterium]
MRSRLAPALAASLLTSSIVAQNNNQTSTLSPIVPGGVPFTLSIEEVEWSGDPLPAIHSAATAIHDGKMLFVGGKTSGLHGFTCDPAQNFPPAHFNRELYVVDLASGDVFARSIDDPASGLTGEQRSEVASINTLRLQVGDRLLVVGGYGLDTSLDYATFGSLRIMDVPGTIAWAMGDSTQLVDHVKFVAPPAEAPGELATTFFTLTGGEMIRMPGTKLDEFMLCLGQSFQQGYGCTPGFPNQTYSRQIRRFAIDLDAKSPVAIFRSASPQASWARRRDLNIFPARVPGGEGAVVAAGPVTPGPIPGIWTVPIVVGPSGLMSMDDPNDPATLKQGFAAYASSKLAFWSTSRGENWLVAMGGIGYVVVENGAYVENVELPYSNASFALRYAPSSDAWSQHLMLDSSFPTIVSPSSGETFFFGTETLVFPLLPTDSHDMFDLDALLAAGKPVEIALLHGGIVAEGQGVGSFPNTYASNVMFKVSIEPACIGDFTGTGSVDGSDLAVLLGAWGPVPTNAIVPSDLNGDGEVNGADLGLLLSHWGPCGKP